MAKQNDDESYARRHWKAITIGSVLGFIVLLLLIGLIFWWIKSKKKIKIPRVQSINEFMQPSVIKARAVPINTIGGRY